MATFAESYAGATEESQQLKDPVFRLILCDLPEERSALWRSVADRCRCQLIEGADRCEQLDQRDLAAPHVVVTAATGPRDSRLADRCQELFEHGVFIVICDDASQLTLWRTLAWDALLADASFEECVAAFRSAMAEAEQRTRELQMIADYKRRLSMLTPNEMQVLEAVCGGRLNKQIASELRVSVRTIEQRRRRVFEKMGVESAVPLAALTATVQTLSDHTRHCRHRITSSAVPSPAPPAPVPTATAGIFRSEATAQGMVY